MQDKNYLVVPLLKESSYRKPERPIDLEWHNFSVVISTLKGPKKILSNCTGYVKHGQFLSIMGPSGIVFIII